MKSPGDLGFHRCNPDIHHRRSIRLRDHDYSQSGQYFITLCIRDRWVRLFGDVLHGTMALNEFGGIVSEWVAKIPERYDAVGIDSFVVMPNHVHLIVVINDTSTPIQNVDHITTVGAIHELPLHDTGTAPVHCINELPLHDTGTAPVHCINELPLHDTGTAPVHCINELPLHDAGTNRGHIDDAESFRKSRRIMTIPKIVGYFRMNTAKQINEIRQTQGNPVWQRNYWEHVIRNDRELRAIHQYIINNPVNWSRDKLNKEHDNTMREESVQYGDDTWEP